ncbi:hypothetical protein ACFFJX_02080 [Pseudarcicella hirudinis]|uniref:hypothetical protein n=1 Tax=Pseudarcicella hirudinis TaxID=1079859 RepID=UPI0035E5973A
MKQLLQTIFELVKRAFQNIRNIERAFGIIFPEGGYIGIHDLNDDITCKLAV